MATTVSPPPAPTTDENPEVQSLVASWYAGTIGRREFLMRGTVALGTLAAATTLLEACGGKGATATPFATSAPTSAPTTAATRAAGSAAAPVASPSAASPSAASPAAATTAASSTSGSPAAATAAPPGTTAAGASAPAGTRPAGSAAASSTTTSGSAVAAQPAGTPVATGVAVDAVNAKMVQFKSGTADIIAYEARPKTGTGPFPAVIVIHENVGLTDHIKDVTRRLAKEGYVGLGIDFLSRDGGTMAFSAPQDATAAIGKIPDEQMIGDVNAAITYLTGSGVGAPKVGVVGFCLGGRWTLVSSEKAKGLSAAVAFYGPMTGGTGPTSTVDVIKEAATLTCPLMGNYGALDALSKAIPAFQDAAKPSGKPLDFKVYENTGHAFNNDTRPFVNNLGYVASSAMDAWTRTLGWFKKYLA